MKIAISGTNGYIGQNLVKKLKELDHECILLERKNLYNIPELTKVLKGTDAVIHLAGAPILRRWTDTSKTQILNSRVITSSNITEAINLLPNDRQPKIFISASAIGIYASGSLHNETSRVFSTDFVGEVVRKWENSSSELPDSVRKIIFRIGLVIGREAKTMTNLLPIFKFGLGGKIGSGKQPFPFIHIQDVLRAMLWGLNKTEAKGIYNLVAPERINNYQFTKSLATSLHRPAFFTVPEFALKLIYGEAAKLLFQSPEVIPERLIDAGFQFEYPDIDKGLQEILK